MLSNERKLIDNKWVFKKNLNVASQAEKYKVRYVEKWYSQLEGIDINEIVSHISKLISIRRLMTLAIVFDLEIEHMDVNTIHGDLERRILYEAT